LFSYAFAVKLTDRNIKEQPLSTLLKDGNRVIKVERKESAVFLISSDGYICKEDAQQQLVSMLMRTKITLLEQRIPHQDWWSFNTTQRFATEAVGSIFENRNIVAISFKPQVYETKRYQHWPGASPAEAEFSLDSLQDIALSEPKLSFATIRTVEALNVLGLALADPHAKSKLILAMTAVEILSDRRSVDEKMVDALDALKEKIPELETTPEIASHLTKILEGAKKETISKAGKRLVKGVLGGKRATEFYKLYEVRSELVHGNASRLTIDLEMHGEIEKYAEEGFNLALELTLKLLESVASASVTASD